MGTYGVSWKDIAKELIETLDDIEGDFSNNDLAKALHFIQGYAPTINSNKGREEEWEIKLRKMRMRRLLK